MQLESKVPLLILVSNCVRLKNDHGQILHPVPARRSQFQAVWAFLGGESWFHCKEVPIQRLENPLLPPQACCLLVYLEPIGFGKVGRFSSKENRMKMKKSYLFQINFAELGWPWNYLDWSMSNSVPCLFFCFLRLILTIGRRKNNYKEVN